MTLTLIVSTLGCFYLQSYLEHASTTFVLSCRNKILEIIDNFRKSFNTSILLASKLVHNNCSKETIKLQIICFLKTFIWKIRLQSSLLKIRHQSFWITSVELRFFLTYFSTNQTFIFHTTPPFTAFYIWVNLNSFLKSEV